MDNKLKVQIIIEIICWTLFTLKNILFNFSAYFIKEKETKVKREGDETSIAICIQDWINYQEKRT